MLLSHKINQLSARHVLRDGGEPTGTPTPPAPPAPTGPPAGYVPQDQVTAIAAREKDQGARAKEAEIADALGVTIDEAKNIIKASKERDAASQSEAEKATAAASAAQAKAAKAEAIANEKAHAAEVKLALIAAGVPTARLDVTARLVDSAIGDDEAAITAAVTKARTEAPEFFPAQDDKSGDGKTTAPATPPRPSDAGTPPKSTPPGGEGAYERGLRLAAERAGQSQYPALAPVNAGT